jgi:hypothetical protein
MSNEADTGAGLDRRSKISDKLLTIIIAFGVLLVIVIVNYCTICGMSYCKAELDNI